MVSLLLPKGPYLGKVHGMPFYLLPHTCESVDYLFSSFEPYTTELFQRAIRPDSVVLDIGAQLGYFSLLAARWTGPKGKVFAFEPAPSNFALLESNVRLNGYASIVHPVQKAVGEKNVQTTFFIYRDSASHVMYPDPQVKVRETISVECIAIDDFLEGRPVDVIKMDIEGNEPNALKGMSCTIQRNPDLVLFAEYAPAFLRRAGVQPEAYITHLESLGFYPQMIDEDTRRLRPVARETYEVKHPTWHVNLYCTKMR